MFLHQNAKQHAKGINMQKVLKNFCYSCRAKKDIFIFNEKFYEINVSNNLNRDTQGNMKSKE